MNVIRNDSKAEVFFKHLVPIYCNYVLSRAIYVVTKLQIAEMLEEGALNPREIAEKTSCHADNLLRVLNLVESRGIFKKNAKGRFENSEQSLLLRRNFLGNAVIADQDRNWKKLAFPNEEFIEALQSQVEESKHPLWELARGYIVSRAIYGSIILGFEKICSENNVFTSYLEHAGILKNNELTSQGELLLDEGCQEFFKHDIEERWLAVGEMEEAVRKGSIPFTELYGETFFDYLGLHPEKTRNFDQSMTFITDCEIATLRAVILEELKEGAKVVDIGGGHGKFLSGIIEERKETQGVLFDLPTTVREHKIPIDLQSRCEIVGGSFFEKIPAGDVYIIKRVLHDWDDADCVKILQNCKKEKGTKLLLVEFILPNPLGFAIDVNMLCIFKGRERTEEDFNRICFAAGWKIQEIKQSECGLATIVAIPI